jgi:hypothetical protein
LAQDVVGEPTGAHQKCNSDPKIKIFAEKNYCDGDGVRSGAKKKRTK